MSTQVRVVAFACLAWMHLYHSSFAQEPPASPGPESEPIEFIDNSRPPQTEVSNPRPTETVPTGWGFATFSPDSKSVATVSVPEGADAKGEVLIWNLDDLKAPLRIELPGKIAIVSFSPDGKWLAIGPNEPRAGVQLVDTKTGKVGMTLPGPVAKTNVITWSPDGTELVLGSTTDKTVRVWNVTKKEFVRTYEPEASKLLAIDLSGSGRLLAAIIPAKDPEGLALYDVFAGTVEKSLKGHKQQIEGAAFTGAGKQLATVGWDAVVRVWDIDSGEETAVIKGHKKGIRS
ncbi:WD40 repeat domain-containing protein, partial [Schlesneria sp.]